MKKDAYFFPHYCNARHDRKLKRVQKELGVEGYGIFFMLLEVLREQTDFKYPISDIDLLADEFGTSEQKVRTVISNYDLFYVDEDEKFVSPKLIFYLQPYLEKVERARAAARVRWDKSKNPNQKHIENTIDNANVMQMHNKCNADAMQGDIGDIGEVREDSDTNVSLVNSPTVDDTCPHEKIIGLWHDRLPQCPKIRKWGESSKKNLRTRWRESKECQDLSWWSAFFEYISQSDFLTGKKNDFIATLGWVVKRTNFEKIINGNYENRGPCTGSSMTDSNIKTAVSWAERKKQQLKNEERNLIE